MARAATFGVAVSLLLAANSASAETVLVQSYDTGPPPPNDCSGVFGTFPDCVVNGSPIIIKISYEDGEFTGYEISSAFPTITGDEFEIFFDDNSDFSSGTWTYAPDADDPAVTHWVAKGGNEGFNLFTDDPGPTATSGVWYTPSGALSHLSFYDTEGGGGTAQVPAPAALILLGLGLTGLVVGQRVRSGR